MPQTPEPSTQRLGGLQNWVASMRRGTVRDFFINVLPAAAEAVKQKPLVPPRDQEREAKIRAYLDECVLSMVREHPDTLFYFVQPAVYRYVPAVTRQTTPGEYLLQQYAIRYIVGETAGLPNVRIFGFDDQPFTNDISHYSDTRHHDWTVCGMILDCLQDGTGLLTPDTVEAYLARAEQAALEFDIPAFNSEAQRLMQEAR